MKSPRTFRIALSTTLLAGLASALPPAFAHSGETHPAKDKAAQAQPAQQTDWGIAGDAQKVDRSIDIVMTDAMRFVPDHLTVRLGETIRFRLRNSGVMMHEMVVGTPSAIAEHAALMLKFPTMAHEEAYMVHVPPGQSGEIFWTFNRAGNFDFACLIAGHYQAGMRGTIVVQPTAKEKS